MSIKPGPKLTMLVGEIPRDHQALQPFSGLVIAFLNELSKDLRSNTEAKQLADVMTFAFWCRKSQLERLQLRFGDEHRRMGRGTVFHITPSNVPLNFAYSFAFGLLAGNGNIVRLPTAEFTAANIVSDAIWRVLHQPQHATLLSMNALVRYKRETDFMSKQFGDENFYTSHFSAISDARIIWGGDATVKAIRKFAIPSRAVEVTFADRYSFCVMDEIAVAELSDDALKNLARNFYNDSYLMDQNACSSPHLIVWLHTPAKPVRKRFWDALENEAQASYELADVQAVDRHTRLMGNFARGPSGQRAEKISGQAIRVKLPTLDNSTDELRGTSGLFYEYSAEHLNDIAGIVNNKYQTLTYFGVDKDVLGNFVTANQLSGIDRIVPVGEALAIDTIWDGVDVLKTLSRIIDVR